jgi:hypothetical protein
MSKINSMNRMKKQEPLAKVKWTCVCGNSGFAYSDRFIPCDTYGQPCVHVPQDEVGLFVCSKCGRIRYALTSEVVGFATHNKLTEDERVDILMSRVDFT